jgi:hypothetical protein
MSGHAGAGRRMLGAAVTQVTVPCRCHPSNSASVDVARISSARSISKNLGAALSRGESARSQTRHPALGTDSQEQLRARPSGPTFRRWTARNWAAPVPSARRAVNMDACERPWCPVSPIGNPFDYEPVHRRYLDLCDGGRAETRGSPTINESDIIRERCALEGAIRQVGIEVSGQPQSDEPPFAAGSYVEVL